MPIMSMVNDDRKILSRAPLREKRFLSISLRSFVIGGEFRGVRNARMSDSNRPHTKEANTSSLHITLTITNDSYTKNTITMPKTLLILGGYGNAGRAIADLLLKESDVHVILAGRTLSLAEEQARKLNATYSGERAKACQVDASSPESLEKGFQYVDMVVVASSTSAFTYQILDAALKANIDYFDIQVCGSDAMDSLKTRISTSTRCFVTQGGIYPGVPAMLVRYAAMQLDNLQKANIYCVMSPNWKDLEFSEASKEEFFRELGDMNSEIYDNGKWEKQGWTVTRTFDFGEPFHQKTCVPMFLDELRDLPQVCYVMLVRLSH